MLCGAVKLEHPAARRLLDLLPGVIHVETWSAHESQWIDSTLRWLASEARQVRPGGEAVITRLADILVIQAIRGWIASAPGEQKGWLRALEDPQIGRAMLLIQTEPGRPWTVEALAREVGMSRSGFAARFLELVGEPPMSYLTRWRMDLALDWLREGDLTIGEIGARLGYRSEAAFNRAFKRSTGTPPGAVRREAAW